MDPITLAALPALIAALGEHLPGLLVAGVMIYLYNIREKQIGAERIEYAKCQEQQAQDYKDVLEKVFAQIDATNASLNSIAINLAAGNRNAQIGEKLDTLAQQIQTQEVKANGNAARGQGQTGRKAG
jgi:hypothetical protein